MKSFEELKTYINTKISLIEYDPTNLSDPIVRSTDFLIVQSKLNDYRFYCETELARKRTLVEASFKDAKDASDGKNITEKRIDASTDRDYTKIREALEELEAEVKWVKTAIDIFNNAHLTYRQLSRE